ncbi:MAG: Do family serine endopeptidase [Alphaproteobacteria bacterium]|nr:Do family serine endopeptidase [Alphaproteobacteria bacterium]MDE2499012.1 Do family serine endopeptidase [Alphaproteobacteria bacterium]
MPAGKLVPAGKLKSAIKSVPMEVPTGKMPHSMNEVNLTFAPVVKRIAPAVVNVYSRSVVQAPAMNPFFNDPFFQQFFGANPQMRQRVQQSLGSGVIVRSDGLILTNNHVIQGGQDIVVALADKREFKAKVILADPRTDLAVLKIDTHGEKLPTVEFGDSDKLQVGDLVLAIGDPFGVGQTVTMGIVSALARTEMGANNAQFFIQTDAAINPGNSGGALVTTDGKLAGINSAIFSKTGESIGIGFAIPANLARRVVEGAMSGGVKLPWIGADGQAVTGDLAPALDLNRPQGVLLKSIFPGGPAANAGLKVGDVVLSIDGNEVDDMQSLNYYVSTHKAGDMQQLEVSSGGHKRTVSVRLALPPENPPRDASDIGGRNPLTGARVENLSPAVAIDLQMDMMAKGVVIVSVSPQGYAGNYGFQAGDIVRAVNGQGITSVGQLKHALDAAGGRWNLVIDRGGQRMNLRVDG